MTNEGTLIEGTLIELLAQENFLQSSIGEEEIKKKKMEIDDRLKEGVEQKQAVRYLSDMLNNYVEVNLPLGDKLQLILYTLGELEARDTIPLLKSAAEKYLRENYKRRNWNSENFDCFIDVLVKFGARSELKYLEDLFISVEENHLSQRRKQLIREIDGKRSIAEQVEFLDLKNPRDQGELLYLVAQLQHKRLNVPDRLLELQTEIAKILGPKYHDALRGAQERAQQTRAY